MSASEEVEVVFTPWPYDARDRGIELLDKQRPGWRDQVDPQRLAMGSDLTCVLGQVFGDFCEGLKALGLDPMTRDDAYYGFVTPRYRLDNGYFRLSAAWREAIVGGAE